MARLPRLDLPGVPQHIVQRGNNRLPCFLDDGDRLRYLTLLREALLATGVQLHAYVLMDNHVHLLATPLDPGDIGRMMQRLGRRYVGQFNGRHGRTGTLWEGRYKACLVDNEHNVLACYRYIELNPVRARVTDDPVAYRWSSCATNLEQRPDSSVSPHPAWLALGSTLPIATSLIDACWTKRFPPTCLWRSACTCSSNGRGAATISVPWSKPGLAASQVSVQHIGLA